MEEMVGSDKVSTFGEFGKWVCGRRVIGDRRRSGSEKWEMVLMRVCVDVCEKEAEEKKKKRKRVRRRRHLISQICGSNS